MSSRPCVMLCAANSSSPSLAMHSARDRRRGDLLAAPRCRIIVLPRCSSLAAASRRFLHSHALRSSPHTLHVDAAGQEVLHLLRANIDGLDDMRMIAMYGSGAFAQVHVDAKSQTQTRSHAAAADAQQLVAASSDPVQPAAASPSTAAASSAAQAAPPMLDLIFVCDDPLSFHLSNMRRNPSHYSFLKHLRWWPSLIERIQEHGAGVWYNTLIDLPVPQSPGALSAAAGVPRTRLIKYGVISTRRLMEDLQEWSSLYIAGRMHKPMHMLQCSREIQAAADQNLQHALHTALLLLDSARDAAESKGEVDKPLSPLPVRGQVIPTDPAIAPADAAASTDGSAALPSAAAAAAPKTDDASTSSDAPHSLLSLRSLFACLASLSYMGDVRMGLAENPHKVENIVGGSWGELRELYAPAIRRAVGEAATRISQPHECFEYLPSVQQRAKVCAQLPAHLAALVQQRLAHMPTTQPSVPWSQRLSSLPGSQRRSVLVSSLSAIVQRSSREQTLKGLATAGVRKSLRYAFAKIRKAMRK